MARKSEEPGVRVTASLTREQDRVLRSLAEKNDVSVAWLIRYAVNQMVQNSESVQLRLDRKARG